MDRVTKKIWEQFILEFKKIIKILKICVVIFGSGAIASIIEIHLNLPAVVSHLIFMFGAIFLMIVVLKMIKNLQIIKIEVGLVEPET